METLAPFLPTPATGPAHIESELIGIATLGLTDAAGYIGTTVLMNAFQKEFQREGLKWQGWGIQALAGCTVQLIKATSHRADFLEAALQTAIDLGIAPLTHIAYFEAAKNCWRTVHPSGASVGFEKLLDPAEIEAANVRRKHYSKALAILARSFGTLLKKPQE